MKFQGIKIEKPEPKVLVIPHNGVEVIFMAVYVDNYDEFDALVPKPVPVKKRLASGKIETDYEDEGYKKEVNIWSNKRSNWMFLKSLSVSEDITWDKVDLEKPDTYDKFETELLEAGFNGPVIERIKMLCFEACGLDQSLIDEATERFLAGRAQESSNETSPSSEQ